jgi:hypothetical protein
MAAGFAYMVLACAALLGCAENTGVKPGELIKVPPRAVTAGDELLSWAPAGANVIVEVDVARLRANQAVGAVVEALSSLSVPGWDLGLLARADALLLCAYDTGSDQAVTLTLVRGDDVAAWGIAVGERTAALGPPALVARVGAVRAGREPSLAMDRALLSVRTQAMPARAEGATVRAAARLSFDARVALASQLDLDRVPTAISVWGDVVDDLAVVAMLQGEDEGEARELARAMARAIEGWRRGLARHSWAPARYLQLLLGGVEITERGGAARVVLVIAPDRLRRMTDRLLRSLPESRQ